MPPFTAFLAPPNSKTVHSVVDLRRDRRVGLALYQSLHCSATRLRKGATRSDENPLKPGSLRVAWIF